MNNSTGLHLSIKNLYKRFGGKTILRNINLEIEPGQFVVIIGKSGCGKSTLLRLLSGLEVPTEGTIWMDQQNLNGIDPAVRMMFQDARLLPWKRVLENVGLGLSGNWEHASNWVLKQVGLEDRSLDWPSILSGGQRQRVALARALVHHPRLLLLDEPLGALDALTRIEMQQLVERIWQNQRFTTLLVTHDVSEAIALADRILLIEEGSITLDIPITLSRPRHRGNVNFSALEGEILHRVMGKNSSFNFSSDSIPQAVF